MPLFLFRLKEEAVSGFLMAAEMLAMLFGAVGRRPMTHVVLVHVPSIPALGVTAVPSRRQEQGSAAGTLPALPSFEQDLYQQDIGWESALP